MIEISDLQKSYGDAKVLSDVSLTIPDGSIYALVGVSGAGKSTLLRCINGLERFDSGSVVVDGKSVGELDERGLRELRGHVGMIFQHFSLLERQTLAQNVEFPLRVHGWDRARRQAKRDELLELVGLAGKAAAYPRELSGGQKQRVAIARALALDPKVLLCDEATSALDPNTTRQVLALIESINERLGITTVIVTHAMSVVKEVCDEVSVLDRGRLTYTGSVQDLFLAHPEALVSVTGPVEAPQDGEGARFVVVQRADEADVLSRIILGTGLELRVVSGGLDRYRGQTAGSYLVTVRDEDAGSLAAWLAGRPDIEWQRLERKAS